MRKRIDFDDFADTYEDLAKQQVSFFERDSSYFAEYKVLLTRAMIGTSCRTIMDFGCGIGASVPFFLKHFPESAMVGCDISEKSLVIARKRYPGVVFYHPQGIPSELYFDIIFASGVFHHISPHERLSVLEFCHGRLGYNGKLVLFEHNPYNPITRRLVSACPFDKDATLLTRRDLCRLVRTAQLRSVRSGFTLFFPRPLRYFRPFEQFLSRIPLGGQYFVIAERRSL